MEVDTSDAEVGAVLSKHMKPNGKLHPCDVISLCLSLTERNYDVRNRELLVLAIKVALEKWCHWLDRSKLPFIF